MSPAQLKERLQSLGPGTEAQVDDLTGTTDHYQVVVVSKSFQGKSTLERHRMVFELLRPELDSGEIHALTMKTWTPDQVK